MAVIIMVLVLVLASLDPPKILFAGFFVYGLSGPALFLIRLRQRARRRALSSSEPDQKLPSTQEGDDVE
jgi:CDP-diacylglycerol--serine O-phosphatidyltransferase